MKILFLGAVSPGQTSLMRARAFEKLGYQVRRFDTVSPWKNASWFARQWQRRFQAGTIVRGINEAVVQAAVDYRPDIVWGEKQEFLSADTLHQLKNLGARLIHFTPDPYFSVDWKRTGLMDDAIRCFDVLVYCKSYERDAYENIGKPLVYMPLGFCEETHRPLLSDDPQWRCGLGFIGGWEPRRQEMLAPLAEKGLDLNIRGVYWDHVSDGKWTLRRHIIARRLNDGTPFRFAKNENLAKCFRGGEIYGDDYARALTGSAVSIGFLRKVCPDQHTTRTFEIPACGSMLLADRTEDHQTYFEEGKEAEYFATREELLDKAIFYASNSKSRDKIASAGFARAHKSGYSYAERLRAAFVEMGKYL